MNTLPNGAVWECGACSKKYKYKYNLTQHQKLECGKTPQFSCHLCDYKAKWKSNLKSHYVYRHNDQPFPFKTRSTCDAMSSNNGQSTL
ncbi:longitudinals lacking protein-like [Macrosteles quadrilineatus]|uniref:longitudinals lacking protein-like n=1 Tax=Macrosteles quadrilineatus TaxID=74068 RepID=UPI0023E21F10|nr:longitudinals lacking protein-like [Macrosteles quadrilineatus]